ncbi:hypothetical protein THRCLA_21553 [Thraustotheca clavata]|uniref:tRNA-splicing endonuclease subunit Sen54 N-terminal domain-containing protein n=1 Tax=Thraustotheca clavata TaxID=74557 RepID=A0A1V9ZVC6_9STRA|nr:hypothetical protein THRCLA_21553 [Thraustotheca clavata]
MEAFTRAVAASESNPVKTRSEATLDASNGLCTVQKQRGKSLFHVGFHEHQKLRLYPEEISCLAHRGVLDIYLDEKLLSLRQVNDILEAFVPRECREAYCFLRERKFFPTRHISDGEIVRPQVSSSAQIHMAYDVHGSKKIEKPLFRVAVFSWIECMPEIASIQCAMQDNVPLKLLVADGEGSFVSFQVGHRVY